MMGRCCKSSWAVPRENGRRPCSYLSKDPEIKDLFLDIAAEELSHMEMVANTANLLNAHHLDVENATAGNVEAHVLTGITPMLTNASGYL